MFTARKKMVPKDSARLWLSDAPPDKVFRCRDGRELKNLQELSVALRTMSTDTFDHHVTAEKNDFANWVKDVIGDEALADDLRQAGDRTTVTRRLEDRLGQLRTTAWLKEKL